MIYGADRIVQMPVMQLYDTGLMQQAVQNARYMYDKAEKRMDDFYKEYDNFVTPIQKDQDWYNENVIGRFRRGIDELYANGEDPLRTATGRAKLAQLARSIDVGAVNKLRTSAQNATEFLKERSKLEAAGLYNPLFAKYDGPDINSYSTLESGAWDKMSPTKMVDMATFGNPYYEGLKANRKKISKNGKDYNVEEISMADLRNIADAKFNELASTPQGSLMYKYYMDQTGGKPELAREMFNQAVADGQRRRIYKYEELDDNYFKNEQLKISRAQLAIQRERLQMQKDKEEKKKQQEANGWTYRQSVNILTNGRKGEDTSKYGGTKGLSLKDRNDFARNYSAYQTKLVPGSHDMNTARAMFSGLTSPVGVADLEVVKRRPVSFTSGSGINFTAHRQYVYGGRSISAGSASNKLLNYMRNKRVHGYVINDDDISVNRMDYAQDAHIWDINGYVRVKKSDLEGFDGNLDSALKLIGATEYKTKRKIGQHNGTPKYEDVKYIDIPVSRTIDSRGFSDSQIDMLGDALNLTKKTAVDRQSNYEEDAYED